MNAMPMLQRCFWRQWQGLDAHAREWLELNAIAVPGYAPFYPDGIQPSIQQTIWSVAQPGHTGTWPGDCLMSVKID